MRFTFLKIKADREEISRKKVRQARSEIEETVIIELTVTSTYFGCKIMRPCRQTNNVLKFIMSRHYRGFHYST